MAKAIFDRLLPGDKERAEIRRLNARIAELEAELARIKPKPSQNHPDLSVSHDT
jgi:hypothetical protein